jgi:outer membrane protein
LQNSFQIKVQEYYQNSANMSASKRAETEQILQQEGQMIQGRQQQASQLLQQENQERSSVLIKKIDSVVADYSKTKGLDLVIGTQGTGTVMYGNETLNITAQVLELLNKE